MSEDYGPLLRMPAISTLPIGRAIVHRATGQIVGPVAPIAAEDWPFVVVRGSETLWRYMGLPKFSDLLSTSTLYFARPDRFRDPFEGRFSLGNQQRESESDKIFRSLYRIDDGDQTNYHDIHRTVVFISCWHRNKRESLQMWNAYTTSSESVVITTSVRAIQLFLPHELMKYGVKYAPLDFPRTEFSHNSLFFYKPVGYRFEREYRILRSPCEDEVFYSNNPDDTYRRVPIRLKKIVHRVISHPAASRELKSTVDELLRRYLPSRQRENSAISLGK